MPETASPSCTFHVPNMDCPSCVAHVEEALAGRKGVGSVSVNLVERTVRVTGDTFDTDDIAEQLRRAGYPPKHTETLADTVRRTPVWTTPAAYRTYVAGGLWFVAFILDLFNAGPVLTNVWRWEFTPAAILALVGAIAGAYNFVPGGIRSIRTLRLDIQALMTIALIGAIILGEFVEAASIGALFSLAELLESRSMVRARDAIHELISLSPPVALVRRDGETVEAPVDEIAVGETIVVRPGDRVALDGIVVSGSTSVNEAALTGESMPVSKQAGGEVFAGTFSIDGYVEVQVTRAVQDTVLAHVVNLVRTAQEKKARIEQFVTRFSRYYTPAVVGIAFLMAIVPPLAFGAEWAVWVLRGLTLLVVSCPCALVISTPVSVVSAVTSAARHGVVITGGQHIEALGTVRTIAFDKTGTITRGVPRVESVLAMNGESEESILRIAAVIEEQSAHPLAQAVVTAARERGIDGATDVRDTEQIPGRGIAGTIGGVRYGIMTATGILPDAAALLRNSGHTLVQVERSDGGAPVLLGYLALADEIRPEAADVVKRLRKQGIREIAMLTGDGRAAATSVADAVGITSVRAECLPEDKLDEISRLRERHHGVAMVGDGINDAPALAAATVGIAMGAAGSPTALEAADIALMADDLHALPYLVRLARKTRAVIRQNIAVSLGIKALMIVGVPFGLVSMTLAVLVGDMGTSLAVTSNAIRLVRVKPEAE